MTRPEDLAGFTELLSREYTEQGLRELVRRHFVELLPDLPGAGSSPRQIAAVIVESSRQRGYEQELAQAIELSRRRCARPVNRRLLSGSAWLSSGVLTAFLVALEEPDISEVCDARVDSLGAAESGVALSATAPVEVALETLARDRKRAARKSGVQPVRPAVAPGATRPAPAEPPVLAPPLETRGGSAECLGGTCELESAQGKFLRREVFCVVARDGSGVRRCALRGRILNPASKVVCDLSEVGPGDPMGATRWEACDET